MLNESLQTVSQSPWHMVSWLSTGIIPMVKKNAISHEWVNVPLTAVKPFGRRAMASLNTPLDICSASIEI